MLRTTVLSLLTAAAFATAAQAQSITVPIAGKNIHEVRAAIFAAASKVCAQRDPLDAFSDDLREDCIDRTVDVALRQLASFQR